MRLSTKARYSLRVLLDLAQHRDQGFIPLRDIAERQGISKKYLDQLMMLLNRSDYLKTSRGAQGGYQLAKDPSEYTLGEILRITEGGFAPLACLEDEGSDCDRRQDCAARQTWKGLEDAMAGYLDNTTLQDILDNNQKNNQQDLTI